MLANFPSSRAGTSRPFRAGFVVVRCCARIFLVLSVACICLQRNFVVGQHSLRAEPPLVATAGPLWALLRVARARAWNLERTRVFLRSTQVGQPERAPLGFPSPSSFVSSTRKHGRRFQRRNKVCSLCLSPSVYCSPLAECVRFRCVKARIFPKKNQSVREQSGRPFLFLGAHLSPVVGWLQERAPATGKLEAAAASRTE